jgi:dihydroorotase
MLTIRRPDDWHLHLRDGAQMQSVLACTAQRFQRAIVMPNLKPPIVSAELAGAYRHRIIAALPAGSRFEPLMTLYLTDRTRPQDIDAARQCGFIAGAKLYPAGATTHSDAGVRSIDSIRGALERMEDAGLPLLVHGEVTDPAVDVFDRESRFIDQVLMPLVERHSELKVVLEHVTTSHGTEFVRTARAGVAGTLTVHHLLFNRSALFHGGLRPHYYCLPVLKRERDREALCEAAVSGSPRFFLGTDSAPHSRAAKEASCGCAGIFTAHAAIELYAEIFEAAGQLDKLEGFASEHGADFYGLARNSGTITLVKDPWRVPETLDFGGEPLVPLRAGETVAWRLQA